MALPLLFFPSEPVIAEQGDAPLPLLFRWHPGIEPLVEIGDELITTLDRDRYLLILRALNNQPIEELPTDREREKRFLELFRTVLLFSSARSFRFVPPAEEVERLAKSVLYALKVTEGEMERKIGLSPFRLFFEIQRILSVRRYTTEGIAQRIIITEEEVQDYLQRNQLPPSMKDQAQRLLFLEKLRIEVRKVVQESYRTERIRWYIPPLPEELILGGGEGER